MTLMGVLLWEAPTDKFDGFFPGHKPATNPPDQRIAFWSVYSSRVNDRKTGEELKAEGK
tara:strand:- start:266 stop:442 length:177 start_codon:yes stop_codon:yes gene_type:complete